MPGISARCLIIFQRAQVVSIVTRLGGNAGGGDFLKDDFQAQLTARYRHSSWAPSCKNWNSEVEISVTAN